jgi:hypothetical protein
MSALRLVVIALALAGALVAQQEGEQQVELQRTQRALQQSRTEVDRLLELRLRHDLGLVPVSANGDTDRTFRPTTAVTTESLEKLNQELGVEDAASASLLDRYNKLRVAVEQLRADADARAKAADAPPDFVTVPQAGVAAPRGGAAGAKQPVPAAAPAGETAPQPALLDGGTIVLELDPPRAQIHGSTDHRRVAQALFRAGQALMDRAAAARAQDHLAAAKELDARAVERLRRALDELAPLLQHAEPPFEALFCQGKCLELLFRHAERYEGLSARGGARDYQRREQEVRDPWLRIAARDVQRTGQRGETEVLGRWGTAAQAALEHFRWMTLHADYDARATIEALTWPGAQGK